MQIIKHPEFTARPWKNGGGITLEAIRVPPRGDDFRWRVSVAHIDRPGPFSEFAGYQRIMVLLKGNGVALELADGGHTVLRRIGDMAEFDGAVAAQCGLLDGKCTDLNLIAAKSLGRVHAKVERVRERRSVPRRAAHATLIVAIDAPVDLVAGKDHAVLARWDLAIIGSADAEAHLEAQAAGATALVFLATVPDA